MSQAIRARWGLEAIEQRVAAGAATDPFAEPATAVETVGQPVILTDPPRLNERLVELLNAEGRLFTAGVTCAFRDDFRERGEGSCAACPVRHTDALDPLTELCNVGVEQAAVLTRLAVARVEADARPEG